MPASSLRHGLDQLELPASIVAIGAFDGVHRGHQELIRNAAREASVRAIPLVVYTFDPPPRAFFDGAAVLTPLEEKLERLSDLGVGHVIVAPFCLDYARRSAETFMGELRRLGAEEIWVGADFRFGFKRSGGVDMLATEFSVSVMPTVQCSQHQAISSSRIRELLARGATEQASELLGRPLPAQAT
jgi:riboflavin kinase/FMN adenylyltransferase